MSKTNDATEAVLDYLMKMNRPYSLQDIANNLQTEHGKTSITKAIDNLIKNNEIKEKIYGKSKIYFVDQNRFGEVNQDEIKNLNEKIEDLTKQLKEVEMELKKKEALLYTVEGGLTLDEINFQLKKDQNVLKEIQEKIKKNDEESDENLKDDKELEKIRYKHNLVVKESRKRKRIVNQILDSILEGYPKPKKVLLEEIGIEKI